MNVSFDSFGKALPGYDIMPLCFFRNFFAGAFAISAFARCEGKRCTYIAVFQTTDVRFAAYISKENYFVDSH